MSTDRELLELAAKAANIQIDKTTNGGGGVHNDGFDMLGNAVLDWHNGVTWNPLTNDGDAFRLAVLLSLQVGPNAASRDLTVVAWARERGLPAIYITVGNSGAEAAARRAIVRAAAEIGRAMP